MAGRIPREFIDDLLSRTDIVDVIDNRVPLKRAGANYKACCPFHGEKTPSFTVSPSKQFYHCFGCGAHGTAVGFLMEYERLDFPDAIEELARIAGVEVPREESSRDSQQRRQSADLYDLMKMISDHYCLELRKSPQAIEYLKQRGLSGETARDFAIGFAPPGWDFVLKAQGSTPERQKQLESAGMLIRNEERQRIYDRFRDRIMFPIRDPRGKVIAFGGRVMGEGEPKYLNSPETPIFHKGRELYGLYEARRHGGKMEKIIVTEGYMDVVMLAQHDIRNAVASLGTACTADHIQRLFRTVNEVVFCFDGDRAGRDAAWRALNNALPTLKDGNQIRFLFLPDGEDPDSLVQKEGKDAFLERIDNAMPLSDYLLNQLKSQVDMNSMDGRARLAELAKPLLAQIQAEVFLQLLKQALAREIQLPVEQLFQNITPAQEPLPPPMQQQAQRPRQRQSRPWKLEMDNNRMLIAALIAQPSLSQTVTDMEVVMLKTLEDKAVDFILELLDMIKSNPNISPAALLDRYRGTRLEESLMKLAAHEFQTDEDGNDNIPEQFQDAFSNLINDACKKHYQHVMLKPIAEQTDSDKAFIKNYRKT